MCYGGIANFDAEVFTKIFKHTTSELSTIIGDNSIGYPEPAHDVNEKISSLVRSNRDEWFGFNPLGELVNSYEKMSETTGGPFERANHIKPRNRKWPGQWNVLQLLSW